MIVLLFPAKKIRLAVWVNLHVLEYAELDLTILVKCPSMPVQNKHFVVSMTQKLMHQFL